MEDTYSDYRQNVRFWLIGVPSIMMGAIIIVFSYYFIPPYWPKSFGPFDMRYYFGPMSFFMDVSIHNGELPLWNPLVFCGTPFAANPQVMLFYPFHLLRSILVFSPSPWSTSVSMELELVFHLLLMGTAAFALAREYKLSLGACLVAAFIYMLGPFTVTYTIEFWLFIAIAAWVPLILIAVRRALRSQLLKKRLYYTVIAGLLFGISTLGGFPQLTFYIAITVVLFCILDRFIDNNSSDEGFLRNGMTAVLVPATVFCIGAMVAAAMLMPASELARLSLRPANNGMRFGIERQDLSWPHLLKSLVVYTGASESFQQGCRAAGIGALLAAVSAFWHKRKRPVIMFGIMYLILTDCTLGPPFPFGRLLRALDIFNFGAPWRFAIISSLPFAILTGFGIDAASRHLGSRFVSVIRSAVIVSTGCVSLVILARWFHTAPYTVPAWLLLSIPSVSLIAICLAGWIDLPKVWRVVIPALIVAEIMVWDVSFVSHYGTARTYARSTSGFGRRTAIRQTNYRGAYVRPQWNMWTLIPIINGYDPLYIGAARQVMCASTQEKVYTRNLRDWAVMVANQRGNLFLKRSFWLARQYVRGPLPDKKDLFPAATTVFLPKPSSLPLPEVSRNELSPHAVSKHTKRIHVADAATMASSIGPHVDGQGNVALKLPDVRLSKRHSVLCLRYRSSRTVSVYPYFSDPGTGRYEKGMKQAIVPTNGKVSVCEIPMPDFDTVVTTLVWKAPATGLDFQEAYVLSDLDDEDSLIRIVSRKANSVEVHVSNLPDWRVLTFVDANYPGWKAYVDSKSVPIMLADDAFKAVLLPPGSHEIRFVFRPWSVYVGIFVSVVSILAISVFLVAYRRTMVHHA